MAKKQCKNCGGTGVLFFRHSDDPSNDTPNIATIERCDVCRRFKTDHTASKAVERMWKSWSYRA
jgi:hypothetical protein